MRGAAALSLIPSIPQKIIVKINDVADVNQRRWLEESRQLLEKVAQTHLVLVNWMAVQQKACISPSTILVAAKAGIFYFIS